MIKCAYCGYENKDDASFCIMCKEVFKTLEREVTGVRQGRITFKEFEEPKSGWFLNWHSRAMYTLLVILVALVLYYVLEAHPRIVGIFKYMATYTGTPKKIPLTPTKEEEKEREKIEIAYTMGDYSDIVSARKSVVEKLEKEKIEKEEPSSDYREIQYFVTDNSIYYSIGEFTYVKELTPQEKAYVERGAIEKVVMKEEPKIYIVERPVPPSLPSRKDIVHPLYGGTWIVEDKTRPNYDLKRNLPKLFDVKRPRVDKKQIYLYNLKQETLSSIGIPNVNVPNMKRTEKFTLEELHKDNVVIDKLDRQTVGKEKVSRKKISN